MKHASHTRGPVRIPIEPLITEGPAPRDPANVRMMLKEIHRLERWLGQHKGDTTTLRELLLNNSADGHWEVPG